jgi:hypothetical protein
MTTKKIQHQAIWLLTTSAVLLCALFSTHAEQGGAGHYYSGATAAFIDAAPDEPGLAVLNDFLDYNNANANAAHGLPFGSSIALNVNANVQADVPIGFWTFSPEILGAHYAVGASLPYVWVDIKAKGTIATPGGPVSASRSDYTTGLGDIEFWPFILGWKQGDFKYDVRLAVYAPSGQYESGQLANAGLGYWTFEPEVTFSWLSSKIGTEASLFTGFDFNTENTTANYQSGDIFHIDGTVAQHLPLFGGFAGVGANAFYYKQFTADSGSGAKLGSFEAMSEGIGPEASYIHPIGKMTFAAEAKWLPQTQVDNTLKGNFIWVKVALIF